MFRFVALALAGLSVAVVGLGGVPTARAQDAGPADADADGIGDAGDNCPDTPNADQANADADAFGDACDPCPDNPRGTGDRDGDGLGDVCDPCPILAGDAADGDGDGVGDACDNCPGAPNADQRDTDGDGAGDACCAGAGRPDVCDGRDEDCDGAVDEDAVNATPCDTGRRGNCAAGLSRCVDGREVCVALNEPQPEVCDGRDDDCDGLVDEDRRNACGLCGLEPTERCNGLDDDCDGQLDEAADCPAGHICAGGACREPCGAGPCDEGEVCVEESFCMEPCGRVACAFDEVCDPALGECADPCVGRTCDDGRRCLRGRCVVDDCRLNGCPPGTACAGEHCVADPCARIECAPGEFCRGGTCLGACGDLACGFEERCLDGVCRHDPCRAVDCAEGRRCRDGACRPDPCADVICPANFACVEGECRPHPCATVHCPLGMLCALRDDLPQCLYPEQVDDAYEPPHTAPPGRASDAGVPARWVDAAYTGDFDEGDAEPAGTDGASPVSEGDGGDGRGDGGCDCRVAGRTSPGAWTLLVAWPFIRRRRRSGLRTSREPGGTRPPRPARRPRSLAARPRGR